MVRVRREAQEEKLVFEVEDSGMGIPQDEQDKIFAMYYQVKDQRGGRPATGTGIGLAVSSDWRRAWAATSPCAANRGTVLASL